MKRLLLFALLLVICHSAGADGLKKSVTWENLRAHPAPLKVIGELSVRHSSLDAPSLWSVGSETLDRDYAVFDNYKQYIGETGVGYARLQSGWAKTEKKKKKYDFSWLDPQVDGLLEQGVHPWICLCYGNPIYSEHGDDLNAKLFPEGPIMDAWLRYVKTIVARYKGKVTMWEVWNEPDGRKNLDSYLLYAKLFVETAKAIREVDKDAKIAAFGSCSPDREYIRQALKEIERLDGIGYIDYLSYHAYWAVPELIVPAVRQLQADVSKYSDSIKLLQGETGCPAQLEYGHALRELEWDEYSQVKWDLRQMMTHFSLGIPYSVFTMVDLNYRWMLQSFGLIRQNQKMEPVYKRPKFYAVQHVTSVFTPELKACDDVKVAVDSDKEIYSVGIRKGDRNVGCLIWCSGVRPGSSLERQLVDIRISGMSECDPVYVDLVTGYVHELKGTSDDSYNKNCNAGTLGFKSFPVWDAPVLVIDRSEISFE